MLHLMNIQKARLVQASGEVIEERRWSETQVRSSGGGGALYHGTGYIAAPKIHSQTSDRRSFWLRRDADGREVEINLVNWDVAIRPTHRLTVVQALLEGSEQGPFLLIANHTTGQTTFGNGSAASLAQQAVDWKREGPFVVKEVALWGGALASGLAIGGFCLIPIAILIMRAVRRTEFLKGVRKGFVEDLQERAFEIAHQAAESLTGQAAAPAIPANG